MEDYLLIIGGSYEQEPLIRKAKDMGYKTIVIDINEESPGYKISDVRKKISTTDYESAIRLAKEYKIKGVLTNSSDIAILTVAKVCESASLPGISVEVAKKATDKELMKIAFKKNNVKTADFFIVNSEKEAMSAADKLGFPCIIKPTDGAGSRGVLRIDNKNEVEKSFKYALSFSKNKKCIIEQFIEGIEMSADALTFNGEIEILAISDKEKVEEGKNCVAMNIMYPPRFSKEETINAKNFIKSVIKSIGIQNGPAHTEIIRRGKNDFVALEIGARGGGFYTFSKVVPEICGIDTQEQLINLAVGKRIEIKTKQNRAAVLRFTTGNPGIITKLGDLTKAEKIKGVIKVGYFMKIGDTVRKIEKDGDRVGYMIISGNNRKEVIKISDKVAKMLKVKTTPVKKVREK
jgi:biotin carboxylase